ncbi:Flp pilus assembly protein CpaB [Caldanaerobacter subterraneus]|uniref:Flp pilus assembly protein CpaB n=1 Tax=Caldanaerobacter subterraneus TaxID=911092 RepID=A0A7Y2L5Z3_9THEO|nr:Flp pilus assembly protein CpaB [Caldanaerobacter subterraneus]NNG66379.1 Flp pilus assembly protein CpaB [Caldanaerobacter subterraneus]
MRKILLILGIVLIVFGIFMYFFKTNNPVASKIGISNLPVVVAKEDLKQGTVITNEKIAVIRMPKEYIVSGAFQNPNGVVGQVINTDVYAGEQIIDKMIEKKRMDYNKRLVGIKITLDTAVGGDIQPNDKIDLYFKSKTSSDTSPILVASNLTVVSVRDGNGNIINPKGNTLQSVSNAIPAYIVFETDIDIANKIYEMKDNGYFYILKYIR